MKENQKIKLLVISSVVPNAASYGGELVLHRYLELDPKIETRVFKWARFPLRLKVIAKLKQVGFEKVGFFLECLWPVYPKAREVDQEIRSFKPDLILTVAHGWFHLAAVKASQRNDIPLITFFQDWWADFGAPSGYCNRRIDHLLRQTCQSSNCVIGVSEGMLQELGCPDHGILIHDLPTMLPIGKCTEKPTRENGPLKLVYFGNLSEYGPMVESLLESCEKQSSIELHVFGPKPKWTPGFEKIYREKGFYHGAIPPEDMVKKISEFDVILVAMEFDPHLRRRMSTSFPSKLIEGVQHGLPIIVWGPAYCSAVKWGMKNNRALCVTEPLAEGLIDRILECRDSEGIIGLSVYSRGSQIAASEEFNPSKIRKAFNDAIREIVG